MEARDYRNNIIEKGSIVRYIGTRTVGRADMISSYNCQTWIRIDSSGLFYRSDYLEVLKEDECPPKKSIVKKTPQEKILHFKRLRRVAPTQISDNNDGPGYGGG